MVVRGGEMGIGNNGNKDLEEKNKREEEKGKVAFKTGGKALNASFWVINSKNFRGGCNLYVCYTAGRDLNSRKCLCGPHWTSSSSYC